MAQVQTQKNGGKSVSQVREEIIEIPLSQIVTASFENARSGDFTVAAGDEFAHEFNELRDSIESEGQQVPVVVRRRKDGKFDLIVGFRRHGAIQAIATKNRVENPTIMAIVRELTDADAAVLNGLENNRENMRPADLVFSVTRAKKLLTAEKRWENETKLAGAYGLKQTYVGKLLKIGEYLQQSLYSHWRKAKSPLPVLTVWEIAKMPPGEQEAEYRRLTDGKSGEEGKKSGSKSPIEKAQKLAVKYAGVLGTLEAAGAVDTSNLDYDEHIMLVLRDSNFELEEKDWQVVAEAAKAAHNGAIVQMVKDKQNATKK